LKEAVIDSLHRRLVLLGREPGTQANDHPAAATGDASAAARLLFRKGFRRRVSLERRLAIESKIRRSIEEDRPLGLVVPFGGYKHFWNPSAPLVDWAEVFHLEFMIHHLTPLTSVIPAGVRIEYVSEDFIVPLMDNYLPADLDRYAESFRALVSRYQAVLPAGLAFDFWRLSERYDTATITDVVLNAMPSRLSEFGSLDDDARAIELKRSTRSVNWRGWSDLTSLDTSEREARVVYARVMEKTFSDLGFLPEHVGGYYEADLRSCVVFSWGTSLDNAVKQFLTLHSAPGSTVDHWIGRGVVIPTRDERLRTTIVSRTQYEASPWSKIPSRIENLDSNLRNLETVDLGIA